MNSYRDVSDLRKDLIRLGANPTHLSDKELDYHWRKLSAAAINLDKKQKARELNEIRRNAGITE